MGLQRLDVATQFLWAFTIAPPGTINPQEVAFVVDLTFSVYLSRAYGCHYLILGAGNLAAEWRRKCPKNLR